MKELTTKSFFSLDSYLHKSLFEETDYVWDALLNLKDYLKSKSLGKIEIDVPETVHLVNPSLISIGKGTIIEPGAYIEGPCIIGPDCLIRHGAYIRGMVVTGKKCVIGHATEIKHSILLNHVSAAHFNYVGDSILGNEVNLGAGAKCANLRLDHDNIRISFQGKKIKTSLKKLGAILGDGAQLGCNCVTNPGTVMGKKSICFPCLNIGGFIPAGSLIKSHHQISSRK